MTQIQRIIDDFVKGIKSCDSLCDYCFIKDYSSKDFPNPLSEYMIAVSVLKSGFEQVFFSDAISDTSDGSIYKVSVRFRVYAPQSKGGKGLAQLAYELCQAICENDIEPSVDNIQISEIQFDTNTHSIYRDVITDLCFCIDKGDLL